jgi:hypothetical protein
VAISRDLQKSKVYAWENEIVRPRDPSQIPFTRAPALVMGVWLAAGLLYPPPVEALNPRNKKAWATGSRLAIRLRADKPTPTWVILHEIAHAMTSTHDGDGDRHGPDFVGVYMQLLERHLCIPIPLLMFTAHKAGVKFNIAAKPRFIDHAE